MPVFHRDQCVFAGCESLGKFLITFKMKKRLPKSPRIPL